MISGDFFFATRPTPRVAYPGRPSSRHIRSVPSSPSLSSRQFATVSLRRASRPIVSAASRFPSRPIASAARYAHPVAPPLEPPGVTIRRLPCRYSSNGFPAAFSFSPCSPLCLIDPSLRRLLLPACRPARRVEERGEGRFRAFVSISWIARFIYITCLWSAIL